MCLLCARWNVRTSTHTHGSCVCALECTHEQAFVLTTITEETMMGPAKEQMHVMVHSMTKTHRHHARKCSAGCSNWV